MNPVFSRPSPSRRRPLRRLLRGCAALLIAPAALLPGACSDEADQLFAPYRAFLRFTPVTHFQPLYAAVNNPGMFCTITWTPSHYLCTAPQSTSTLTYPRTALDAYGRPDAIAGFIIGTPSVPDFNGVHQLMCFDLACPACYEATARSPLLKFTAAERVSCSVCEAAFDLSGGGIAVSGGRFGFGGTLLRYRMVTYAPAKDLIIVQN